MTASRGDELRELRLDRDLSITDLASMLRLRPEFLEAIEDGRISPHTITYLNIKKALGAPRQAARPLDILTYHPDLELTPEERIGAFILGIGLLLTSALLVAAIIAYAGGTL